MSTSTEERETLDNQRDTGRLEAFSDGVFAVAITLLVLNIQVPTIKQGFLNSLPYMMPNYLSYITSFLVIGLFWANHHYMFKYINRTDHFFLLLNILLLMFLVLIPFTTQLLTAFIYTEDRYIVAVVYCGTLLLTSAMYNLLWCYASVNYRLVDSDISPYVIQRMTRRYLVSIPLYLFTLIIAVFSVEVSLVLNIIIALVYTFPTTFFRKQKIAEEA
jgi:TMEM175 potassium channel family protein